MKLWVSNPLWALHWFGSPSNWLRSTPQSLPEAFITHCHAADCTQGFPSTVCKCTARISDEIRPLGVGLQKCFSVALNPHTSSKTSVQCFVVIIQHKKLLCFLLPILTHNSVICCLHKAAGP